MEKQAISESCAQPQKNMRQVGALMKKRIIVDGWYRQEIVCETLEVQDVPDISPSVITEK